MILKVRNFFAVSSISIILWWILFVAIEISVHGLLLYNGIWANIPKLVRRDEIWAEKVPLRFLLPPIIKPSIKEVPYYIGDSCILGLPGPKSCFPGHGYDYLMHDIEKLPPIYPGCKLVVTCVIDGRSGMSEAEINKKSGVAVKTAGPLSGERSRDYPSPENPRGRELQRIRQMASYRHGVLASQASISGRIPGVALRANKKRTRV